MSLTKRLYRTIRVQKYREVLSRFDVAFTYVSVYTLARIQKFFKKRGGGGVKKCMLIHVIDVYKHEYQTTI